MKKAEIIRGLFIGYTRHKRSIDPTDAGTCRYEVNGNKCVVGRMLKPKCLSVWKAYENKRSFSVEAAMARVAPRSTLAPDVWLTTQLAKKFSFITVEMATELQLIHDSDSFWDADGMTLAGEDELNGLLCKLGLE